MAVHTATKPSFKDKGCPEIRSMLVAIAENVLDCRRRWVHNDFSCSEAQIGPDWVIWASLWIYNQQRYIQKD